jgi:hypothetical protein
LYDAGVVRALCLGDVNVQIVIGTPVESDDDNMSDGRIEAHNMVKISLEIKYRPPWREIDPKKLRIFIAGNVSTWFQTWDLIFSKM